ncbi:MAG: TM0106 family RecB-like putative nuclease, partial [Candidatus Margulisiibacteriota bacterium]
MIFSSTWKATLSRGGHGLEYLFGWQFNDESEDAYHHIWAFDPALEKETFERFVAMAMQRWANYPQMHIYHFSPYEPVAIKRLMGKYNTCEDEIDRMLRAGLFIDLHSIVKQSLRAGIENYSLKELEIFHAFNRAMELRTASQELRTVEYFLEHEDAAGIPPETSAAVEAYNREDCLSTRRLRNWLEQLRSQLIASGAFIARPELVAGDPSEALTAYQEMIANLFRQLTHDLPIIREDRNDEQQGVWLLANMLDWYRRENKAGWWEYFRMKELPDDELLEEKTAISGLLFTGNRQPVKKSVIDTYTFPLQECEVRVKDKLKTGDGGSFGEVEAIDLLHNTIAIKKGPSILDIHPNSVFKFEMYLDKDKQDAITRVAQWIARHGIDHPDTMYRAARDLLLRLSPRTRGEVPLGIDQQQRSIKWSAQVDHSYLPIQGPPGAGKSHTAAEMILSLIAHGYTIGITALSHKVIRGLLDKVLTMAWEKGIEIRCIQKVSNPSDTLPRGLTETTSADDVPGAIESGQFMIAAGTSWLWSKQSLENSIDYLFVDEAGQFSLIDTLAVSQAAKNMILLGDPQQLKQPQQGTHPEGTELSALEHLLNGSQTIPDNMGIFLSETWRLHPAICTFISELFYNSRLYPKQGLEQQAVIHDGPFSGSGLFFQPVEHEGNQSSSTEEVNVIVQLVNDLKNKAIWVDSKAESQPLTAKDIMIIAPYNAQVAKLTEAMPDLPIGTVDKFQGQEAPLVIFSLSSSSPEDAPRGMDFLYSLNRLNVAVS